MAMAAIALISHQSDPVAALAPFARIAHLGRLLGRIPDYIAHFVEYFCLALAVGYGFHDQWRHRLLRTLISGLLIVGVFACTDELHQAFIPKRTPDIRDFRADMLGAACSLSLQTVVRLINRLMVVFVRSSRDPI